MISSFKIPKPYFFIAVTFVMVFLPVHANAGIIEFLFPSLRQEEYDPTKDMLAPFASEEVKEKQKLNGLPVNAIALDKPHLLSEEIGRWVMVAASEAMNFESGQIDGQINKRDQYFDTTGKGQYVSFLRSQKLYNVVQDGRYKIRSYSDQEPLLLNEGVVQGRYRWLFRIPMVVSYLDKSLNDYKKGDAELIQRATLNIQIGRIEDEGKPDGLQIEQWSGSLELQKASSEDK